MNIDETLSRKIKTASLLCAAMVVAIHVTNAEPPRATVLWWWWRLGPRGVFLIAVPFFFVVSGFMLAGKFRSEKEESGKEWLLDFDWHMWEIECLKRVRSLLVPYLLWCSTAVLLFCGPTVAANLLHGREVFANIPNGWRWWAIAYGVNPFSDPLVYPLWYLRSLMLFVGISPLLYLTVKWGGRIFLAIVYILWLGTAFCESRSLVNCFAHTFSVTGIFFFCLGMRMRINEYTFEMESKTAPVIALLMGMFIILCGVNFVEVKEVEFMCFRVAFVPFILFAFWNLIPTIELPHWLVRASLPIYLAHILVWQTMYLIESLTHRSLFSFLAVDCIVCWLMKWAVGFVVPLLGSILLYRYLPRLASVFFGGRK